MKNSIKWCFIFFYWIFKTLFRAVYKDRCFRWLFFFWPFLKRQKLKLKTMGKMHFFKNLVTNYRRNIRISVMRLNKYLNLIYVSRIQSVSHPFHNYKRTTTCDRVNCDSCRLPEGTYFLLKWRHAQLFETSITVLVKV